MVSEADVALDLLPERGLPPVDLELVGIENRDWHSRIRSDRVIGGNVFRTQLKPALLTFAGGCQPVYFEAQVGQHLVINDVVEEYGIRIERIFRQDHAVIKGFALVANGVCPIGC